MPTFPQDCNALGQEGFLPTDPPIFSPGQPIPSDHQSRFQHSFTSTCLLQKPLFLTPSILFIRRDSSSGCALPSPLSLYLSCYMWIEKCNRAKDSL